LDLPLFLDVQKSLRNLLKADADRISAGYYPPSVLVPEPGLIGHFQRLPKVFQAAMGASRRRFSRQTRSFSARARKAAAALPAYYRRCFHFQQDGYLSEESAALYEHQVELLFVGAGDAMRRLLLAPLKRHFERSDGKGLRFLELGCGCGSATRFLKAAFPEARITAVDLSEPYLQAARQKIPGVTFLQAPAENLPFPGKEFDAVVSVFLFHELPLDVRRQVLRESHRVLKTGGMMAFVDSLQLGDAPGLDEPLRQFPKDFHEPFYPGYIRKPMEKLLAEAGFRALESGLGFFSKVQAAVPVEAGANKGRNRAS
jgi:ubiquinone/menaquinone biosynthesis C-methylase UbiE